MVRLPQWAAVELKKIAERKGLPFATTIRELICERLREVAPAEPRQEPASAAIPRGR